MHFVLIGKESGIISRRFDELRHRDVEVGGANKEKFEEKSSES